MPPTLLGERQVLTGNYVSNYWLSESARRALNDSARLGVAFCRSLAFCSFCFSPSGSKSSVNWPSIAGSTSMTSSSTRLKQSIWALRGSNTLVSSAFFSEESFTFLPFGPESCSRTLVAMAAQSSALNVPSAVFACSRKAVDSRVFTFVDVSMMLFLLRRLMFLP